MEYRLLGATGLVVSDLGLGTLTWGQDTDAHEAAVLLQMYMEAGGNFIDLAAESKVGQATGVLGALLEAGVNRADLVLCLRSGATIGAEFGDAGPGRVRLLDSLNYALEALRTDHVDIWIVQGPKRQVGIGQVLSALEIAYRTGKARHVGLSGFGEWDTALFLGAIGQGTGANGIVTAGGAGALFGAGGSICGLNIDVLSEPLSLLMPEPGLTHLQRAHELGMGFIGWAPLARGVLTGKYTNTLPADSRAASTHLGYMIETMFTRNHQDVVDAVMEAAKGLECSPAQVALAWARDLVGLTTTVFGPRTARQLEQLIASGTPTLPEPIRQVLHQASLKKLAPNSRYR